MPGRAKTTKATWDSVNGAVRYKVTHFRSDNCGYASTVHYTTGNSSGSGLHANCGAPDDCYYKKATVQALDGQDNVIASQMRFTATLIPKNFVRSFNT